MYAIFAITRLTLIEALRNRLVWLFLILLLIGLMLTEFLGGISVTESKMVKASLLGASLRIIAVFVVSLFVLSSMIREMHDKGLELTLALPVSRGSYYLAKLLGYSIIALMIVLLIGACLIFYAPVAQVLVWSCVLFCELLIMVAACLLCVFTFNQMTTAFTAVVAFYVLARSINAIQLMSNSPMLDLSSPLQVYSSELVNLIAYLLPDLHRFSPSSWLVYPDTATGPLWFIFAQTGIYVLLLGAAGLFDLYRKNI